MKNNKGFTLIEMLGAIIIIGIISIIAYNTFTSSLRGFRDDYYTDISRTLEKSGQEFFNDNRNYRPGQILGAQKVSISALETQNYIKDITDYNGDKCENTSYVLIVKEGREDYSYHTCLVCSEDNYDNTDDEYCDSTWLDPNSISYGIGDPPTLYVYKNTPRDEVKEKLKISVSYVRKNSKGEIIKSVRGDGEDNLPTILPVDIDVVDTSKIGTYTVHYEYKPVTNGREDETVERKEGRVIVYENDAPYLNVTYKDTVARHGATLGAVRENATETVEGNYISGEWHQEITVKLSPRTITEPGVTPSRYQWKKADGRWVDFCTTTNSCSIPIASDMNETVEFRMIDTNGKISKVTTPVIIRRDKTKPRCTIQDYGTKGDENWYRSNVEVKFTVNEDVNSTYAGAISGVKLNNVEIENAIVNRTSDKKTNTHKDDTKNVKYIGYVEDNANNFNTCEISFKRDVTPPVCELKTTGTYGSNSWYVSDVEISFKTTTDVTSDVRRYGIGDNDETGVHSTTHKQDTTSVTYNAHIRDIAGNTSDCSIGFKRDTVNPTCSVSKSNLRLTAGVTTSVSCSDDTSKCSSSNTTGEAGLKSSKTYTVYDNAGHSNTCSVTVTPVVQKRTRSCSSGGRCEAAGCETWGTCENSACGVDKYKRCKAAGCKTHNSCATSGCGCKKYNYTTGYHTTHSCGSHPSNPPYSNCTNLGNQGTTGNCDFSCTKRGSCKTYKTCENSACGCATYNRGSQCGVESYKTCTTPGCGCATWNANISACGCASWGDWGSWSDSACSDGEASDHSSQTGCQTIYE